MSLWNPFTFTRGGAPAQLGATPPALRVVGGPATATQLAAARMAFNRFCGVVRTSPVPNPSEIGSLADGTRYQITVVGPSATMTIWPVAEEQRIGGIGITLVDLAGNVIRSHSKNGAGVQPQPYILVPKVVPGTRRCTGEWTIKKVDGYAGGKAVHSHADKRNYLTYGFGGSVSFTNAQTPAIGVNNSANESASALTVGTIYVNQEPVSVQLLSAPALPFLRKRINGESWLMRLAVDYAPSHRLRLYGEKLKDIQDASKRAGELFFGSVELPTGATIISTSLSASADGNRVRAVTIEHATVDVSISDGGLRIESITGQPSKIPGYDNSSSRGDGDYIYTVTDRKSEISFSTAAYGFNIDGSAFTATLGGGGNTVNGSGYQYEILDDGGTPGEPTDNTLTYGTHLNDVYRYPSSYFKVNNSVVATPAGQGFHTMNFDAVSKGLGRDKTLSVSGGVQKGFLTLGTFVLFADALNLLHVSVVRKTTSRYSGTYAVGQTPVYVGGEIVYYEPTPVLSPPEPEATVIEESWELTVVCGSDELLSFDTGGKTAGFFDVTVAADPFTGAVCVNLVEYTTSMRTTAVRSWLFLADSTGGKFLHEAVKEVADSRDIKAIQTTLVSV